MNIMLIHGQGRTPVSMSLLGWRLSRRGYKVHYFAYFVAWQRFEDIVDRLVRTIRREIGDEPYALVTHSLGGLIARAALPRLAGRPPRQLVMLAPPNRPPQIAKWAMKNLFYRRFAGDSGRKLIDEAFYKTLPEPTVPATIIAGGRGWPERISPFGDAINDGILTVEETKLAQADQVILVRATHPFIMNSKAVERLIGEVVGD